MLLTLIFVVAEPQLTMGHNYFWESKEVYMITNRIISIFFLTLHILPKIWCSVWQGLSESVNFCWNMSSSVPVKVNFSWSHQTSYLRAEVGGTITLHLPLWNSVPGTSKCGPALKVFTISLFMIIQSSRCCSLGTKYLRHGSEQVYLVFHFLILSPPIIVQKTRKSK